MSSGQLSHYLQETTGYKQAFNRLRDLKPQIEQLQALLNRRPPQKAAAAAIERSPSSAVAAQQSGERLTAAAAAVASALQTVAREPDGADPAATATLRRDAAAIVTNAAYQNPHASTPTIDRSAAKCFQECSPWSKHLPVDSCHLMHVACVLQECTGTEGIDSHTCRQ